MSKKGVAIVIGMASVDRGYRKRLKKVPQDAMAGYDVNAGEMQAIAGMDHEQFDKMADMLNRRMRDWLVDWAVHEH